MPQQQQPQQLPSRSIEAEPQFAAFLAIDWADETHAWMLEDASTNTRTSGTLQHTPEAIQQWALQLSARYGNRPIAVGLEQSRGALVSALLMHPFLVIYPIHPTTSARFRSALHPSGAKDDPKDAKLLLDLLVRHRDRLRPLQLDTESTRLLESLVELRRQLVDRRTAFSNTITASLKLYFPQLLGWFEDLTAPLVADFFDHWPTLQAAQAARPDSIRKFFRRHRCPSESLNQTRIDEMRTAIPLTADNAIIRSHQTSVRTYLDLVAVLRDRIRELDKEIAQLFQEHADAPIFDSFPGAGDALAPRLLAAFGSLRDRYASANELQSYSGIAPVISRSGKQCCVFFRRGCPKFLRQTFHEYANCSMQKSGWAREFYDRQKALGKGHHAAVRALAFKWIRILFRCWKDSVPYREDVFLAARARNAPQQAPSPA